MCPRTAVAIRAATILLSAAAAPQSGAAHELSVFAYVEGRSIQGEVFVGDGAAIANAKVTAFGPRAQKLAEAVTDGDGHFSLEAPFRCDYRLVVDGGEGHLAEYSVSADELPNDLPPLAASPPKAAVGEGTTTSSHPPHEESAHGHSSVGGELESLRKQVIELRKDLAAFQQEIRFRDLLGGIGFILGLTGVASYFLAARRGSSRRSKD